MTKRGKYESFKISAKLMRLIREYAANDKRSIKATIEMVLRERFGFLENDKK